MWEFQAQVTQNGTVLGDKDLKKVTEVERGQMQGSNLT